MSYLSNRAKFFGWDSENFRRTYKFPKPFEAMPLKRYQIPDPEAPTPGAGEDPMVINVNPILGLCNGTVALAQEELRSSGITALTELNHSHLAIGTATTESGEEAIFVEYADNANPSIIQVVKYDPTAKVEMLACLYNLLDNQVLPMKFDGTPKEIHAGKITCCEAAWIAILKYSLKMDPTGRLQNAFDVVKQTIEKATVRTLDETETEETLKSGLISLCLDIYRNLSVNGSVKLTLEETANQFRLIKKDSLDSGAIAPAKGKKILETNYKVFCEEKKATKMVLDPAKVDIDAIGASIPFMRKYEDFSEEEKKLIPEVDPRENISETVVGLVQEVARTWGKIPELQCSRILLEGGAGSGKTYTVRSFCAHTKRPYVTHVCGTTDGPDSFLGYIVPYIEAEGHKLALVSKDTASDIMNNPALLWPEDLEMDFAFDPEGAKAKVGEMFDKFKELFTLAHTDPAEAQHSGVKYTYIPGSISEAVEKGYAVEIQEPTCLLQQGAMSCLFDILDKGSIGIMSTPRGVIHRHPDFICFITQNRKYKGTKPLNEALRSRFTHIERMEDPKKEEIIARVSKKTGVEDIELIAQAVELFEALKEKAEDLNTDGTVTLRNLYDFVDAIADGIEVTWAFERKMLNPITTDREDRQELIECVEDLDIFDDVTLADAM